MKQHLFILQICSSLSLCQNQNTGALLDSEFGDLLVKFERKITFADQNDGSEIGGEETESREGEET